MSWTRTRWCQCGECRSHSPREPGWETCPSVVLGVETVKGRWLWIKNVSNSSDLENQDKAYLKQQVKAQVYEDVGLD